MSLKRFGSIHSTPPGGYIYEVNGETISSKSRLDIAKKAKALRIRHGLPVRGDCFQFVMDYMCPLLPNGFCNSPSKVKYMNVRDVKVKTQEVFHLAAEPVDTIQHRLETCITCPSHSTKGVCPTCTGLIHWVVSGFGGRRPQLPHDIACGVCKEDGMLVAATASVIPFEPTKGANYPEHCWRKGPANVKTE